MKMDSKTQKYSFEVNLGLGCNCMGCCMDESIDAEVELTEEEMNQLREWLDSHEDADFSDLEEDLPDLHSKIEGAALDAIFWWAVEDGIAQGGYEDNGFEIFEQEVADGTFVIEGYDPETDGELEDAEDIDYDEEFERWSEEKDNLDGEERVNYLEARYGITDGTDISCIDYTVNLDID